MASPEPASNHSADQPWNFRTTHWSVVLAAGGSPAPEAAAALERLCASYWYPIYSWLRRQGHSTHDAQDLTQSFFSHLLEKNALNTVDRSKGRFRSFLLASTKNFLANEWDKASALKRGGQFKFVSVDETTGEERYRREPALDTPPDKAFEQSWAMTLLDSVLARLREEYSADGKTALFEALQNYLEGGRDGVPYADMAARLNLTEGALKMAVLRLRRRFGELLRSEIAHTVARPEDIDEEIRSLFAAVSV
jgi:RNA polymerase sigma-70 factor (ECF subfamily)